MARYVIGVDVGGTNTDAVLLDPAQTGAGAVIASHKTTTGADISDGIERAIRALMQSCPFSPEQVAYVSIGTTHFINALVERDPTKLERVAVIRLASSHFTEATPPFVDFPVALKQKIHTHTAIVSGGLQVDGALIGKVNEDEILEQAAIIKQKGIRNVAIVGIYSPTDEFHHQEEKVKQLLEASLDKGVNIICSKEIAGIGILARENATILNGSILNFARQTIRGFKRIMARLGLTCALYLTSNSGQLLSADEGIQYPIKTVTSGPTNSIRGASYLTHTAEQKQSKYIVDIGGTTTDIGCLLPSGFPRLAAAYTEITGVRVNFAMPQVESVGLGGGSIVRVAADGSVTVGPDSVGKDLEKQALCFGGDTMTATDILVAAGEAEIGSKVPAIDAKVITAAKEKMRRILQNAIDRMKTSLEPCQVTLVGGGSFLCPSDLTGVAEVERPTHAAVANAAGAAVAEIGARAELIVDTDKKAESVARAEERAVAKAVEKGAKKELIRIIEKEVSELPYIAGKCKIAIEVAGPVDYERLASGQVLGTSEDDAETEIARQIHEEPEAREKLPEESEIDPTTYRPNIGHDRIWRISETDLHFISIGCYLLGCGGGGTPYTKFLETRQLLRSGAQMSIVSIQDLADDVQCPALCGVGSPAVGVERPGGHAVLHALQHLEKYMGVTYGALLAVEIGGGNGLEPLFWGSSQHYNLVCVDGDLMGRAFPSFEKITPFVGAKDINDLLPSCLTDGDGSTLLMTTSKDPESADKILRAAVVTMGSAAGAASKPLSGKELKTSAIPNTHSLSWRLGRAVAISRKRGTLGTVADDIIREFGGEKSARKVFSGKIVGVGQSLRAGHSYGDLVIQKLQDYERDTTEAEYGGIESVHIPFKNENLILEASYASGERKILATVPDLIIVVDSLTGEAVGVPEYRYGLKVFVVVAAAHPLWTSTARAVEIAGPSAFGYDVEYVPFGQHTETRSVIDEYAQE